MSGEHGYHLSVFHADEDTRIRVQLSTEAAFGEVFRFGIETGDLIEVADERRHVSLEFIGGLPSRHLVVQTEPPGAPIALELRADGEVAPIDEIRLGAEGTPARSMPIAAADARVSAADVDTALGSDIPGIRLWYVPLEARGNPVELDERALRDLRALGHVP